MELSIRISSLTCTAEYILENGFYPHPLALEEYFLFPVTNEEVRREYNKYKRWILEARIRRREANLRIAENTERNAPYLYFPSGHKTLDDD
jgi:hypothetical protein